MTRALTAPGSTDLATRHNVLGDPIRLVHGLQGAVVLVRMPVLRIIRAVIRVVPVLPEFLDAVRERFCADVPGWLFRPRRTTADWVAVHDSNWIKLPPMPSSSVWF